ncbi:hypothetical protein WR25_20360 [Diploscapter pachys]|uniref:Uncharacterized protein n=1 Tax=Diploscapter pachys TaxID=2018661 RepID=A0A2A2KIT8_9BILA|nr:hypothetical protein WR25_20360 [Diploscapter pachys]
MSAKAKSDAGIRMIRKTSAEDPAKQQQHLKQVKEKNKEKEKQITPQKGKESKEPAESAKNAEKDKADETGRKAKEEMKIKATITCIAKEKDEKEGSREKPKKNEEIAKKKTPTDREIKMLEVKGVVANESKKSNEKEKQKSPEGRRRKERKKGKMRREKLRDGMVIRNGRSSLDSALEDSVSQEKASDKKLNIEFSYPPF